MKNEVYEADYSGDREEQNSSLTDGSSKIWDTAVSSGYFKTYSIIMDSLPKVINPKNKQSYEELLPKLEMMAKRWHGKIKGIVDYEHGEAHIYLSLPFFEFSTEEEHALLKELAERTHSLTFTVTEDNMIQLSVMIKYFEKIGDKKDVIGQALEQHKELQEMLMKEAAKRRQALLSHPVIGQILSRAAENAGLTPETYVDRMFENPDDELEILAELLSAKNELFEETE